MTKVSCEKLISRSASLRLRSSIETWNEVQSGLSIESGERGPRKWPHGMRSMRSMRGGLFSVVVSRRGRVLRAHVTRVNSWGTLQLSLVDIHVQRTADIRKGPHKPPRIERIERIERIVFPAKTAHIQNHSKYDSRPKRMCKTNYEKSTAFPEIRYVILRPREAIHQSRAWSFLWDTGRDVPSARAPDCGK